MSGGDARQAITSRAAGQISAIKLREWQRYRGWTIKILAELEHSGGMTTREISDRTGYRCTVATNIQVFACTNPAAVIGHFKVTTVNIMEQESINGDGTEAQTWDAVVNLKNNLNRIRKKLNDIIGGVAWTDTVTASLGTIWAKFNATTGHKHSGAADDAPKIPVSSMEVDIATQAELDTHAALATGVHGAGASTLETIAGSQAKVDTHKAANVSDTIHPNATITKTGTYTGNDTLNRAIAHGLGRIPKLILIFFTSSTGEIIHSYAGASIKYVDHNVSIAFSVTAPDATNFYAGNATSYIQSGNGSTYTYHWIVVG